MNLRHRVVGAGLSAIVCCIFFLTHAAEAQTSYTATATNTSGSWTDSTNWSGGLVPSASSTFTIPLLVNSGSGTLYYSSAQGLTMFSNSSGRGLYVGYNTGTPAQAGNLNISGGTISTQGSASADYLADGQSGSLTVSGNGVYVSGSGGLAMNYTGSNAAVLTVQDSAMATLASLNTSVGSQSTGTSTINLNGGTLTINGALSAAGSAPTTFNFNGGVLSSTTSVTFPTTSPFTAGVGNGGVVVSAATGKTITIGGSLVANGSGGVTVFSPGSAATGILALSGSNNYTGPTNVDVGSSTACELSISNSAALGATPIVNVGAYGELGLTGGITLNYSLSLAGASNHALQVNDASHCTWAGPITFGNGAHVRVDTNVSGGILTLAGTMGGTGGPYYLGSGSFVLASSGNSYGSITYVYGTTASLAISNAIPAASPVEVSGAAGTFSTLDLHGFSNVIGGLYSTDYAAPGKVINSSATTESTLTVQNAASYTYGGSISGNIQFVENGTSLETLSGTNTYTGGTLITGGALYFTSSNALPGFNSPSGQITLSGGAIVAGSLSTSTSSFNAWLSSGLIAPSPSGAFCLTPASVQTDFNCTTGAFQNLGLGAYGAVTYGGTIEPNPMGGYVFGGGAGTLTVNTQLTGTNTVNIGTTGGALTLVLANTNNSYSGNTNIGTGALQLSNTACLGNSGSISVAVGGQVGLSNGVTVNLPLTINGWGNNDGALQTDDMSNCTWAGPIALGPSSSTYGYYNRLGTGSPYATLTITGPITGPTPLFIRNSAASGTVVLSNSANAYPGTWVFEGTLKLGANNALGSGTLDISTNAGGSCTFDLGGYNQTVSGLTSLAYPVPGTLTDSQGPAILTVANSVPGTFGGNITGELTFVLNGKSVETLSGTNNGYYGGTQILGGTLVFASSNAIPAFGTPSAQNSITIDGGALAATTTIYPSIAAWLSSGVIAASPTGALCLTPSSTDTDVNLSGGTVDGLSLGAVGAVTYGGTIEPGDNGYLLGGGGGTLTVNTVLAGANNALTVGIGGGGTVVLSGTDNYMGGTTVLNGTLIVMNNEGIADGTSLAVGLPSQLGLFGAVRPADAAPAAAAVPEPGTLMLAAAGVIVAGGCMGRRRKVRAQG